MKKLTSLLLALALLFTLSACGGAASDPNFGLYEAESASSRGVSVDLEDFFEDGMSIELKAGGRATFRYDGESYSMKWTLDDDEFTAKGGGAELEGTLADGVLILEDVLDSGVNITFVNAAYEAPEAPRGDSGLTQRHGGSGGSDAPAATAAPAPEPTAEPAPEPTPEPTPEPAPEPTPEPAPEPTTEPASAPFDASWWNGRWYGWRVFYIGYGEFAEVEDNAWDVVAEISADGESGTITIWDYEEWTEAENQDDALLWAQVYLEDGDSPLGCMVSEYGYLADHPLEDYDICADPSWEETGDLDHLLIFSVDYVDPENEENSAYIYFVLRPWGMDWEDVRTADTADMLYADMMPVEYDDWYLPQIRG